MIKESSFNNATVEFLQALYVVADQIESTTYFIKNHKIYVDLGEVEDAEV